jgi:phage terminase large subunit
MAFIETTATRKIKRMRKRIRLLAGGSSASKTVSVLLYLIARAQMDKEPTLTSVVSESFPHLRRGAMRDFLNIMKDHNYYQDDRWSKTDFTYTFETGSKLEFFSADQSNKVRGPRRDRLFVNEANNVSEETWSQLVLRTKELAFADWNPVTDFYLYEQYGINEDSLSTTDEDSEFIILTYKDNEALDVAIVREIEKRAKMNKQWGRVYADGRRGEVEGRIFTDWKILDEIPHEARLIRRGMDFGYSVDPSTIVDVYEYNGGYILDEQLYQKGMSNKQLADVINNLPNPSTLVIADSAEPKSIDELKLYGVNILPCVKGRDSVNYGIQLMQDKPISITKRSTNGLKEYRAYMWMTDKDGKQLATPIPGNDHFLDASRYAISSDQPIEIPHAYKPANMLQRKRRNL